MSGPQTCARLVVIALVAGSGIVSAHDLAQSESVCAGNGATVTCTLTLDLLEFRGLDADRNQRVSIAELDANIARVFEQVKERVAVSADRPLQRVQLMRYEIVADDHVARLEMVYAFAAAVATLTVTSTLDQLGRAEHQHLVTIGSGPERQQAVLDASRRSVTLPLTPSRLTTTRLLAVGAAAAVLALLAWVRLRRRD